MGKIGWVSLNDVSKFFFEFDSNIFCRFKDHFFKVQAISVMADGLPLMFSRDGEPHFSFYWKSSPTMFNSFDKDLLTLVERVEKVILDHLSASLDARTILSLLLASNFAWRKLVKQAGPGGGYMPSFVVVPPAEEMGQLAIEVDPVVVVMASATATSLSLAATPSLSASVAAVSFLQMLPPSAIPLAPPSTVSTSPASTSRPRVYLDHIYTTNDSDSLWSVGYKPEQKTSVGFVSTFNKNLIRGLAILEENGHRHQEALNKVASLETEVAKWRATARTVWRVECPKVTNATIALAESVRSNHQLYSKADLGGKIEGVAVEKDELLKMVSELEARLKEFELEASKERRPTKGLEELLLFKKEIVEQHEKDFHKAVMQGGYFVKSLDLGLFDPFKDVKDGVLLGKDDVAVGEEDIGRE
ncbi:hypothetical protein HKD37_06G016954 [Glycine soja]